MSKLRVHSFSISIDGYGAGPDQDLENPLGVGGLKVFDWFFPTRTWQRMHGKMARIGRLLMVPAAGVEPATSRSGGERSNPLSYAGKSGAGKDSTAARWVAISLLNDCSGS